MTTSLTRLQSFYGELKISLLLHAVIHREFPGTIALLATSAPATLLEAVSHIAPFVPVLVVNDKEKVGHARALGFTTILPILSGTAQDEEAQVAQILEDRGFLALITGLEGPGMRRFALDENGVFHIHPLADGPKAGHNADEAEENYPAGTDWSV